MSRHAFPDRLACPIRATSRVRVLPTDPADPSVYPCPPHRRAISFYGISLSCPTSQTTSQPFGLAYSCRLPMNLPSPVTQSLPYRLPAPALLARHEPNRPRDSSRAWPTRADFPYRTLPRHTGSAPSSPTVHPTSGRVLPPRRPEPRHIWSGRLAFPSPSRALSELATPHRLAKSAPSQVRSSLPSPTTLLSPGHAGSSPYVSRRLTHSSPVLLASSRAFPGSHRRIASCAARTRQTSRAFYSPAKASSTPSQLCLTCLSDSGSVRFNPSRLTCQALSRRPSRDPVGPAGLPQPSRPSPCPRSARATSLHPDFPVRTEPALSDQTSLIYPGHTHPPDEPAPPGASSIPSHQAD